MRELQLRLRASRDKRNRLCEQIRKLQDALNNADRLTLTGQFQNDLPLLRNWWSEFKDWEKVMSESIRYFEIAMSQEPVSGSTGTFWMRDRIKERMQIVFNGFLHEHGGTVSGIEALSKEIYELRLKEDGLGLTRQSLKKSDRAFRFSIFVLILTILFGIASKVFEPTFLHLQHLIYPQRTDQPAPPPVRVPPVSLLK